MLVDGGMASPDSTLSADLAQKLHVKALKQDYVLEPRLGARTRQPASKR